jgi:hypothetical protein
MHTRRVGLPMIRKIYRQLIMVQASIQSATLACLRTRKGDWICIDLGEINHMLASVLPRFMDHRLSKANALPLLVYAKTWKKPRSFPTTPH